MKKLFFNYRLSPMFAPDAGASGSAPSAPKTLKEAQAELVSVNENLAAANDRASTAEAEVTRLTEVNETLQRDYAEVSATAESLKTERNAAQGELEETKKNLTQSQADAEASKNQVSRLESICSLRGIDPNSAPAPTAAEATETRETVMDQLASCRDPKERYRLAQKAKTLR